MRIFLVGDYYSGTGPANVTKYYIENLPEGTLYQKMRNKAARAAELFVKMFFCDVVCFSGYSKQNILGMRIARRLGKKKVYLFHGCVEYENKINHEEDEKMNRIERQTLEMADLILAVSPSFAEWIKDNYPEHRDKTSYATNAVDDNLIQMAMAEDSRLSGSLVNKVVVTKTCRNPHMVFTVGGGMPRKKIKHICEAVKILRDDFDPELKLIVVGARGEDSEIIDSYDFVEDKGLVPFDKTVEYYKSAAVFVQNSCFETFGLAMVEAVALNCPTLVTRQVGALCLFDKPDSEAIIEDYSNPAEIADKLRKAIIGGNADNWRENIDWEACSWKRASENLTIYLQELMEKS